MGLFSFYWNNNLYYVLVYWVLNIILRLLIYFKYDQFFLISKNKPHQNEYIFMSYCVLGNLLSGFLILYVKCTSKKQNEQDKENINQLVKKGSINEVRDHFYLKIILISILDLLYFSCYFIFFLFDDSTHREVSMKTEKDIKTLFDIITRYILSICFLKIKVFRHHKWSIIAIIFGFLLIVPIDFYDLYIQATIKTESSLVYTAILSLRAFFFPFEHFLAKKLFNKYYIPPQNLLFLIGINQTIILIILTPILYFTKVLNDELTLDAGKIIISIVYLTINFVKQYITLKIVYLISVQSVSFLIISTAIAGSLKDTISFFLREDKGTIHTYSYFGFCFGLIAFFIIIMGTLVYDEIIVINKCGLNLNVKKGIEKRALSEFNDALQDLKEFDEKEENEKNIELVNENYIIKF